MNEHLPDSEDLQFTRAIIVCEGRICVLRENDLVGYISYSCGTDTDKRNINYE
jgi:hypothetical protein